MSTWKLRLAASAFTFAAVLCPHDASGQAIAPAPKVRVDPATTQLPHISVVTAGRGSPVVLIPGLGSPRAVWDGVLPALAKEHRVYLVQVNGFGGDDPRANLRPGVLAGIVADLHDYIGRNRIAGAAVVGHSMGGLVGMMLARDHPADVGKLMIVDSLPYFAVLMAPPGVDPTPQMIEPQARAMRDRVLANYGKPADPAVVAAQTRGLALKPDSIATIGRWAAVADPRVSGQAMYEDLTTDLRPDLAKLTLPITLVYPWNAGGPTKAMADPFYRRQYAAAPAVSYVDIGDAAHMVMLDQPAAFQVALLAFAGK